MLVASRAARHVSSIHMWRAVWKNESWAGSLAQGRSSLGLDANYLLANLWLTR